MGLILPRNPLAFPGSSPAMSIAHPMASGARYAGVAAPGGTFIDLKSGNAGVVTGGSLTSLIYPGMGLAVKSNVSGTYIAVANSYSDSPSSVTFAGIVSPIASTTAVLFDTIATSGSSDSYIWLNSLVLKIVVNGATVSSGITLSIGVPYFIAASARNGQQNFVVVNLKTGAIQTATSATALTMIVGSSTWSVGGYSGALSSSAYLAAFAYSVNNFLSVAQLKAWAAAPWDYWYPQAVSQQIFDSLRIAPATVNYNQSLSISSASSVIPTHGVGKLASITSAASIADAKAVAKAFALSSASSATLAKAAIFALALALSSASAISLALGRAYNRALAIASASALSLARGVGLAKLVSSASSTSAARQIGKYLAAAASGAVSASHSVLKALSFASAGAVGLARAVTKILALSSASSVVLIYGRAFIRNLAIVSASSVTLVKVAIFARALSVASTSAASLRRSIGKLAPIAAPSVLSMAKTASLHCAMAAASSVSAAKAIALNGLAFASASSAALSRRISITAAAASSAALALVSTVAHSVAIRALALSGSIARSIAISGVIARSAPVVGVIERAKSLVGILLPKETK